MWQPPPAYPLAPDAYPVNISYDREARINRLWGIPLIGQFVRWIMLIPHFLVLLLVAIVAAEMGVAGRGLDLEPPLRKLTSRDGEGPAPEVVTGCGLPFLLIETVGT